MADPGMVVPPEIPPSPSPVPPPRNTVFRGPMGMRAGWRALLFLALAAAVGLMIALVIGGMTALIYRGGPKPTLPFSSLSPAALSLQEGFMLISTVVAALIMARIERRKFEQYGLPLRPAFGKDFWIGVVAGFASISGTLAGIAALGGFRLEGIATHGPVLLRAIVAWSLTFVLVGLAEEFSFRGYLQYTLTTGMGFWPSAILLSALFGAAHSSNPGETKQGLLSVVMFGLLFCLFLRRRGTLWWAVGFHSGWDWGQTFFYGVPDSGIPAQHSLFSCSFNGPAWLTGGAVGPEASVFTPIVLAIVTIVFANVYPQVRYRVDGETPTSDVGTQPA